MAFPEAHLYELTERGARRRRYDELEVVGLWRSFLDTPGRFLRHLG
jgi:predicted ATPase